MMNIIEHADVRSLRESGATSTDPRTHAGSDAKALHQPALKALRRRLDSIAEMGPEMPFFRLSESRNGCTLGIGGRQLVNFSSYDYLGLSGCADVRAAAKTAIDQFGTSVSASRLVAGEIQLHRQLECELAEFLGVEDCIVYVSGYLTNVGTIGHLFGPRDLIVHDALMHNSAMEGIKLSGAKRMKFRHGDWQHLDELLTRHRTHYERVLILLEGIYSMDGDIADLPRFIELRERHNVCLMVDEAHSIGVLGARGGGIGEHFAVDRRDVDLWMGTLSKSFASCGGYIGGSADLIEYLRCTSPGFVYSVGMPPSNAAAALAALRFVRGHPERVEQVNRMSRLFLECAKDQGLDTGFSQGSPVVPVVLGDSMLAIKLSQALFQHDVNALPIIAPAVHERAARVRFFVTSEHTEQQIRSSVALTADLLSQLKGA